MSKIIIDKDYFDKIDNNLTSTEKQYIDALKYILKDINFNKFSLITDDLATVDKYKDENKDEIILVLTKSKLKSNNFKLCSLWGLLMSTKISDTLKLEIPWSSKLYKAVWRGSTTGQNEMVADRSLRKFTRFQLVLESTKRPDLIDAGFTSIVQYASKNKQKFDLSNIKKELTSIEQSKFKYIVVADGNSCPYSYFWVLASGSVPLKQDSDYIQYFEKDLVEYVHYIPIKKDFSDLSSKILWLRENDSIARDVANNARNFAYNNFTFNTIKQQIYDLII